MNAENLVEYLAQPAKLYQLPYQEIKNLVEEYPYSASLRQLLLLKSKIEQDGRFDEYLHQFAARSFDRDFLFHFVTHQLDVLLELEQEQEERLELRDLEQLEETEKILIPATTPTEEVAVAVVPTADPIAETAVTQEWVITPPPATPTEEASATPIVLPSPTPSLKLASAITPGYIIPTATIGEIVSISLLLDANTQPEAAANFRSATTNRRQRFRPVGVPTSKKSKVKPVRKVRQIAKQSVKDRTVNASETLAKLLVQQEQYDKAIKIYERLALLNPEKSRFFAATIQELKTKL